jgi:hypothetical protein
LTFSGFAARVQGHQLNERISHVVARFPPASRRWHVPQENFVKDAGITGDN